MNNKVQLLLQALFTISALIFTEPHESHNRGLIMLQQTRRVTTGISASKKSDLISDEQVATITPYPVWPSFQLQDLFYTEDSPPSIETRHLDKPYNLELPEGAVRVIKIRMPTRAEMATELQAAGQSVPEDWTKFNLHRTDSIDFIYILSGSIICVVGEKQVLLKAGDFIAQLGPEHTWINESDEPCICLCVMVGTKK
jgi:mannose-6-phosphate isomerase-like protein (cupin superfamily)